MCEICHGKKTVQAVEIQTPAGIVWVCETTLPGPPGLPPGKARCNRPEKVKRTPVGKYGSTRWGQAPCPLCTAPKLVSSETDEFEFSW